MPTKARIQRRHGQKPPKRVRIVPERLKAALDLAGVSQRAAALKLEITPQRFQYYLRRHPNARGELKPPHCQAMHRRTLARMTRVPEAWLGGDMLALPWCAERPEYVHELAWSTLQSLLRSLEMLTGETVFHNEEPPEFAIAILRHLSFVSPTAIRLPPLASELFTILDELDACLREPAAKSIREATQRLRMLARKWHFTYIDNPSLAQVAESRLVERCWGAWQRGVRTRYPAFDPVKARQWCELPAAADHESRAGALGEWSRIRRRLGELLSLPAWRSKMLGDRTWQNDRNEDLAAVPALAEMVEMFLKPWLEGTLAQIPGILLKEDWDKIQP